MNIYIVRSSDPLDMEGSPDVAGVFLNEELANDARDFLKKEHIEFYRTNYPDRDMSKFYFDFEVEPWPVHDSLDDFKTELKKGRPE
jgi:hypothetical protein